MMNLEDVSDILDSQRVPITASDRVKGPYPYYGANGIQDYVNDYIFDDELVLLAEDGGNFGSKERPIAYRVSGKCWVNNHAHVLKPNEFIDVDYLCYSLMFYDVTSIINGATRQKLNQASMRKIQIPVLPIEEQKKIAEMLDKARNLISLRKKQIEKLDLLVKVKFIDIFGDMDTNPNNFPRVTLDEICIKITDGKHGGCEVEDGSGYYFIGAREIYDGEIHYDTAPEITYKDFEKDYKRCNIENGDFVIVNTGATIGKTAIANSSLTNKTLLQKSVALLKAKQGITYAKFLQYCYITNPKIYKVESASAQPNLLISKIKKTSIYLPPLDMQSEFVLFEEKVEKQKVQLQQGLEKLELSYKALMQQYFG